MMHRLLSLLLLLLPAAVLAQQAPFPEPDFDCGKVRRDTVLVHTFQMRNDGDAPLTLLDAVSSCPCIQAEISVRTLLPGEAGQIVVTFRPEGKRPGPFQQLVRVYTDCRQNPFLLHLKGSICTEY